MAEAAFDARPDFAGAQIRGDHEGSFMIDIMLRSPSGDLARLNEVALALSVTRSIAKPSRKRPARKRSGRAAPAPDLEPCEPYGRNDELATAFAGWDCVVARMQESEWNLRDAFSYAQSFAPRFFWDGLEGKLHLRGDAVALARGAGLDEAASLIEAARLREPATDSAPDASVQPSCKGPRL